MHAQLRSHLACPLPKAEGTRVLASAVYARRCGRCVCVCVCVSVGLLVRRNLRVWQHFPVDSDFRGVVLHNPHAFEQAVYRLFVSQLEHVAKPQAPLFKKYFYLLENLADVQAFCMCIDLGATETLETLFKTLFDSITYVACDHAMFVTAPCPERVVKGGRAVVHTAQAERVSFCVPLCSAGRDTGRRGGSSHGPSQITCSALSTRAWEPASLLTALRVPFLFLQVQPLAQSPVKHAHDHA